MIVAPERAHFSEPITLECGRELPELDVSFESYGALNAARDNAILLCHAYTSDHHAAGKYAASDERPGWWDALIGPGRPLDTERFFILSSNCLGGAAGTTGPASINPQTGRRYAMDFPVITLKDMVDVQARLADSLGIDRFHSVIGGCFGGAQALQWMASHPERLSNATVICATAHASVHTIALSHIVRAAICADPLWNNGNYYDGPLPSQGLALFTMFGSLFWQDRELLQKALGPDVNKARELLYAFTPEFEIEKQLARVAVPKHATLDPNSMMYLARANDYFNLARGKGGLQDAFAAFAGATTLIGVKQDWRYPVAEITQIAQALRQNGNRVRQHTLDSPLGHGVLLRDLPTLAPLLTQALEAPGKDASGSAMLKSQVTES